MAERTLPNFVDTDPAPNLYRVMDEFATPTTDYEAALRDVRGAVRDLQATDGGAGQIVNVLAFGLTGDGSDQTAGFVSLGTYLRAHPGSIVLFPGGDYFYSDNKWMVGVTNVRIIAAGARFKCTGALSAGDGNTVGLWTNNGFWTTEIAYPASGWIYDGAHKFATAAAGDSSITCLTAAEAGDFQAGDVVLLSGYEIYPGGWPPSCRFTELAEVASASASTGVVGLTRQIRWAYDQRWRDNGSTVGAPRIMRLSRRAGWALAEDIYIEGVTFLRGTEEPSYMSPYTYGGVYAIGARRITMVRCKIGNLNPSCCERFLAQDCEIDSLEVDKFDDRVHFERCDIRFALGGTGSNALAFRDCRLLEEVALSANHALTIDNCDVHAYSPIGEYAMVNAEARVVEFTGNRLFGRPGSTLVPLNAAGSEIALTLTAVGAGYVKCALTTGTLTEAIHAWVGNRIYSKTQPFLEGVISAVYWDGSAMVIEASFNRTPTMSDALYLSTTKLVRATGNVNMGSNDLDGISLLPFTYHADVVRDDQADGTGRVGRLVVPFPRIVTNDNQALAIPGMPYRVVAHVMDAVSGYLLGIYPTGLPFWSRLIDCSLAGARSMDWFGAQGAQGSDSISAIPDDPVIPSQMNVYWYTTPETSPPPKGILIFEYLNPPGGYTNG